MKVRLFAVSLVAGLIASPVLAGELYRWIDKDGKVNYTDQPPPPDARQVQEKRLGGNSIDADKLPFATKDAVKKNPVTLYASNCGAPCEDARSLLSKRGIPYTTKNPESSQEDADGLRKLVGELQVPVLVVGGRSPIKGFEASSWESALDSAGYPKTAAISRRGDTGTGGQTQANPKSSEAAKEN